MYSEAGQRSGGQTSLPETQESCPHLTGHLQRTAGQEGKTEHAYFTACVLMCTAVCG